MQYWGITLTSRCIDFLQFVMLCSFCWSRDHLHRSSLQLVPMSSLWSLIQFLFHLSLQPLKESSSNHQAPVCLEIHLLQSPTRLLINLSQSPARLLVHLSQVPARLLIHLPHAPACFLMPFAPGSSSSSDSLAPVSSSSSNLLATGSSLSSGFANLQGSSPGRPIQKSSDGHSCSGLRFPFKSC